MCGKVVHTFYIVSKGRGGCGHRGLGVVGRWCYRGGVQQKDQRPNWAPWFLLSLCCFIVYLEETDSTICFWGWVVSKPNDGKDG